MVVRDFILLTLFLKFLYLAQLLCHVCPICSCLSRIWQTVVHPSKSKSTNPSPWSLCMYSYLTSSVVCVCAAKRDHEQKGETAAVPELYHAFRRSRHQRGGGRGLRQVRHAARVGAQVGGGLRTQRQGIVIYGSRLIGDEL